jgi:lipoyl(octanoyl) transferase
MSVAPALPPDASAASAVLQAYLLGAVDFDAALALQRRLIYEVRGDRGRAALILCEHPPLITVGRQGSAAHVLAEPRDLAARQWRVRWVNRGGGSLLHVPGQLAVYPILPLDRLGLNLQTYLDSLHRVLRDVLADFSVDAEVQPGRPGVWAGGRLVAGVGVAVRDWVSYYGAYLNINPALEPFRLVRCDAQGPMTSLERQRRGPVRPALVRERLLEHFCTRFPFARVSLFSDHPALGERRARHSLAAP